MDIRSRPREIGARPRYGTIGSFSHARFLENQTLECLVRGPRSLGSRLADRLPLDGARPRNRCGKGLPSFEFPSPAALANDSSFCADVAADPEDTCHYYSGG